MTAIECLKMLRKCFLVLLVWNLLLTGALLVQIGCMQAEKLNQEICNLEAIPENDMPPSFVIMEE